MQPSGTASDAAANWPCSRLPVNTETHTGEPDGSPVCVRSTTSDRQAAAAAFNFFAMRLFCRAAAFLWMRPLRAARSRSVVATARTSADAPSTLAFLRAVRNAERCARLRAWAARDFRMFFFAEAIFGTGNSNSENGHDSPVFGEPRKIGSRTRLSIFVVVLAAATVPLNLPRCLRPSARAMCVRRPGSLRLAIVIFVLCPFVTPPDPCGARWRLGAWVPS